MTTCGHDYLSSPWRRYPFFETAETKAAELRVEVSKEGAAQVRPHCTIP
jgi:hypothetical protein